MVFASKIILFLTVFMTFLNPLFTDDKKVFPVSTEMQIGRIKTIIDRAPKGIFVTVGGERAFRGASMFEGIERHRQVNFVKWGKGGICYGKF